MDIIEINSGNLHIYLDLCQSYEREFSSITGKTLNDQGLFELDTQIGGNVLGYLLYENKLPIGLAAIKVTSDGAQFEVCEFYIVPDYRKAARGKWFAIEIFKLHRGRWEVKQIVGAEYATKFWRKSIGEYTGNEFREDFYQDEYWGEVVRQRFVSACTEAAK